MKTSLIQIYEDTAGEWRWRAIAKNGRIVADSGEGYKTRGGAQKAVRRLPALITGAQTSFHHNI